MGEVMNSAAMHDYRSVAIGALWIIGTMSCVICVFRSRGLRFIRRWFNGVAMAGFLFLILTILFPDERLLAAAIGCLELGMGWSNYFATSQRVNATFVSD